MGKKLLEILPSEKKFFDGIIDGAGGDIIEKGTKIAESKFSKPTCRIAKSI